MMLIQKVKDSVKRFAMLDSGDVIVVAVSGGPDSVCLLHILHALSKHLNLRLHVAHLDHMFRGKESADEACFVSDLAKNMGIPAVIERIDVPALCRLRGLSPQAGAREARYDFFSRVAASANAARIATGHTATDQAETLLLRLIRGAGVQGLSAIPPVRGNIIRPLIEITREAVLEHLRKKGLNYVSDPSNAKPVYTRNRIRSEVLPVLMRFNPRIVETLAAEARLLRDENEAAEQCLSAAWDAVEENEAGVALPRERFNAMPVAFRRRLLIDSAGRAAGPAASLSSVQVESAIVFMAHAQTGRVMQLPSGLRIERQYDKFIFSMRETEESFSHVLRIPGTTPIPELGLEVECLLQEGGEQERTARGESGKGNYFWQAVFDYDKILPPLKLRTRLPGDWFCPAGMKGKKKKLQDYFVDVKVPRRGRSAFPLLVSGNAVLWVVGLRTDERFQPCPGTKNALIVRAGSTNSEAG